MRFLILALLALPFSSCIPIQSDELKQADIAPPPPEEALKTPVPATPSTPSVPAQAIRREISGVTFEGVSFDSRDYQLLVADQVDGPGSKFTDAAAAARASGGVAAVNAGFFTPEGTPLGLVVSAGEVSGIWNSASSLGSGIWYESPSAGSAITRRERMGYASAKRMRELIQAGPLLVVNGQAVSGLEETKPSIRTLIAWDGGTRWWIGRSSHCTLATLGQALVSGRVADWNTLQALNLDGGRSSDLWISDTIPGGPVVRRTPWNRAVRNFLILVKK